MFRSACSIISAGKIAIKHKSIVKLSKKTRKPIDATGKVPQLQGV